MYRALKYAAFAGVATLSNIATQHAALACYGGPGSLYAAMAAGTLAGLAVKYVLDKKYIFYHRTGGMRDGLGTFILYTIMGIITTFIFWGTELLFNYLFTFTHARYLGAVIGLAIGYVTKYRLDRRFVFMK